MDDATSSPHLPTATACFPDTLPVREPRFARGTGERSRDEVRAMLAASVAAVPPPQIVVIAPRPAPCVDPGVDPCLLAILDEPLGPGETSYAGFARKEAALGAAFARLSVLAARVMHTRLTHRRAGDEVAEKFGRLTVERRHRLLTFLADARRREAISARR